MHSNIFSFGELMLCSLIEMDKANKDRNIYRRCGDIRNNDIPSEEFVMKL